MDDDQLYLEDWKMTKDRISHFNEMLVRIRVGAFPIAAALLGAGILAFQNIKNVELFGISAPSLVFMASAGYLIPISFLDWFHYRLLRIAVEHARGLENCYFEQKLQITNKLTSPRFTKIHTFVFFGVYIGFVGVAVTLAYLVR